MATLSAWGFIGDTIGIMSFFVSLFGKSNNSVTAAVRVYAAINGASNPDGSNPINGADGAIDHIQLYDKNQQIIGNGGSTGYIGSGQFKDVLVPQLDNRAAYFAEIFATNDAICTPAITMTFADGQQFPWTGDWGWKCGLDWYWGNVPVNGNIEPRCTWIDNDHTNGIKATMLMIGWTSFASNSGPPSCGYPAFRAYNGGSSLVKARDTIERPPHNDTRLIVSSRSAHNATELCLSETSYGPDFVSKIEGFYCDMATREIHPLCDGDKITTGCFSLDDGTPHVKRDGEKFGKGYTDVMNWD